MKLALDVWYEAWGRTGNGDAAAAAKHGEAMGAPQSTPAQARPTRAGCLGPEAAGDVDPPAGAGP